MYAIPNKEDELISDKEEDNLISNIKELEEDKE